MDYSLLEFGVYAFITYSSVLMLIISTIKEIPVGRSMSISRAVHMILGVICAIVLMGAGPLIYLPTVNTTTISVNTTEVWTETQTGTMELLNGTAWMVLHLGIAAVLILFIIQQVVMLLFKTDT